MNSYNIGLISSLVLFLYIGSLVLVKLNRISLIKQKRFWNIILLVSFMISGILGLVLAFSIENKLSISWYLPMLWIHVETGIVMALIAIFHAIWHWRYFKG